MQGKVEICGVNTARLPVLSAERTRELLRRVRRGDQAAREELIAGNSNLVICYREYKITTVPIEEALQMKKTLDPYMLQVANDTYM